jgi:hypothetical protein
MGNRMRDKSARPEIFRYNKIQLGQYNSVEDPEHWRHHATEMRTMAAETANADCKAIMLRLAKDFDWLADCTACRTKSRKN